jgi:alpha-glucosidase
LHIEIGRDKLDVRVCKSNMIEVDYRPEGRTSPPTKIIGTTRWASVPAKFSLDSNPILISTSDMIVKITRSPCRVSVLDSSSRLLIKEPEAKGAFEGGLDLTGSDGSHFFGIRGFEYLDKAGSIQELAPRAAAYRIGAGSEGNTGGPFVWSNKGYGVFVDTIGGKCSIADPNRIQFSGLSKPNIDFYVMVGNAYTLHTLLDNLTGMPPMFPKWALGLFNSGFCGIVEPTFRSIVDGYRTRDFPFDTYVFDFDWKDWSGDHYGEWNWNPQKFPSGSSGRLKQDMDAKGIKMVGIMKPRIHVDSEQGRYATREGLWVKRPFYTDYFDHGKVGDLDFAIPAAREWFWDHSIGAFNLGIVGWWNDEADARGDDLEFMYMAQAQYEGQRKYTKDQKRVYTINRNFYSGSQRYAYATWSGDIDSGFEVMQDQRARLLASLNIGQAKWAMDTGGFNNNNHVRGKDASECYARWMEFDAFVPIFRLHGTSRRQPWLYGPVAEAAAAKAAKLRYSLLPYLYAYDRTLSETGIGICRPLVWDYPDDSKVVNDVDAWMFGDSLLVAPVVDRGQTSKPIYLPAGTWIDYFRGSVYTGGHTISYPVNPITWDDIPLFIKRGAIIPKIEVMNYVGERPVKSVTLDIFPANEESDFTYYDDDGITYRYEHGAYFSQKMSVFGKAGAVNFSIAKKTGTYRPPLETYLCKFHNSIGRSVLINGRPAKQYPHVEDLNTAATSSWTTGTDIYGPVTYVRVTAGVHVLISIDNH